MVDRSALIDAEWDVIGCVMDRVCMVFYNLTLFVMHVYLFLHVYLSDSQRHHFVDKLEKDYETLCDIGDYQNLILFDDYGRYPKIRCHDPADFLSKRQLP